MIFNEIWCFRCVGRFPAPGACSYFVGLEPGAWEPAHCCQNRQVEVLKLSSRLYQVYLFLRHFVQFAKGPIGFSPYDPPSLPYPCFVIKGRYFCVAFNVLVLRRLSHALCLELKF
jgi:hypothetical protein